MKRAMTWLLGIGLGTVLTAAMPEPRPSSCNGEFQFSVTVDNRGVDGEPAHPATAYLWIPPDTRTVRGLVVTQQNVGEQPFTENPAIREACARNDLAIVWFHPVIDIRFERRREEAVEVLLGALAELGRISGYEEIGRVPWITFGHSTTTTFARNLAEARPERTIAIISAKGGIMLPLAGSIPGVYSGGHFPEWRQPTHDWTKQGTTLPGLSRIRDELRQRWRPVSYVEEFGGGHFDYTGRYLDFLALYIDKAVRYRLNPDGTVRPIRDDEGVVVDVRPPLPTPPLKITPFAEASGDLRAAPWFFDRELAEAAVALWDNGEWSRKNQIVAFANLDGTPAAFAKSGIVDPVPYELADDGVTITRIPTTFLNRLPDNFTQAGLALTHATSGASTIEPISGIFALRDGQGRIELNRGYPDTPNFIAVRHPGDAVHRPSLQPGRFVPPAFAGQAQKLVFPSLADRPAGPGLVDLQATSSAGLPVHYFVRVGPARIEGNQLLLLPLPPRARLPVAVTVVAWQLGRGGENAVAAAPLVEQTFQIVPGGPP